MSRALVAGAVLSAGLISGGMLMQSGAFREADASTGTPRLFEQVMARIRNDYIDAVDVDTLFRKAAAGFVMELEDPHSVLLTPDRASRLRESTQGRYAGIGVEIDVRDGFVTVIAPIAGTPADSAGILPGDRIVSINDRSTFGLSVDDVHQVMRGPAGSIVKLTVERGESEHPTFTLRRAMIEFHPVQRTGALPGNAGYVELATFSARAAEEVRRAVESLRAQGARSLILDMRGNPGGLLEQGIEVADLFLDTGRPIASTRGRTDEANQSFADKARQPWPDMPVVVLVDSGSASAAEIVAGALQDNQRAVLVGSPTYGKGSAQSLFPLAERHMLKLTTARWFTPDGATIERDSTKGGVTPDVIVRDTLGVLASRRASASGPLTSDPVVARALELLRGAATPAALRARARRR